MKFQEISVAENFGNLRKFEAIVAMTCESINLTLLRAVELGLASATNEVSGGIVAFAITTEFFHDF